MTGALFDATCPADGHLKPANILVTKQGIKLLDFGLASPGIPRRHANPDDCLSRNVPLCRNGSAPLLPACSSVPLRLRSVDRCHHTRCGRACALRAYGASRIAGILTINFKHWEQLPELTWE